MKPEESYGLPLGKTTMVATLLALALIAIVTIAEGEISSAWIAAMMPAGFLLGFSPLFSRRWLIEELLGFAAFVGLGLFTMIGPLIVDDLGFPVDHYSSGFEGIAYVVGLQLYGAGLVISGPIRVLVRARGSNHST